MDKLKIIMHAYSCVHEYFLINTKIVTPKIKIKCNNSSVNWLFSHEIMHLIVLDALSHKKIINLLINYLMWTLIYKVTVFIILRKLFVYE